MRQGLMRPVFPTPKEMGPGIAEEAFHGGSMAV